MPNVLIAGGSGLIGSRLSELLKARGYNVGHLSRRVRTDTLYPTYQWDIRNNKVDPAAFSQADYVINLAGESVAGGWWTPKRKKAIIESRVNSARLLREAMIAAPHLPKAYLSSAAMGYYGDRGDQWLIESDGAGEGFLSESCAAWEKAIGEVAATGIRTAAFRIGLVLSSRGGALQKMLWSLYLFVAPYFGNGRQWYSWVHIDDICRFFIHAIENEAVQGIYNGSAPVPVTNRDFVKSLHKVYRKPSIMLPVPAFALRMVLGEMADVVLMSTRLSADKIKKTGFNFLYDQLEPALEDILFQKK